MGCGASVSRSKPSGQKPSSSAPSFMASLQGHMPNHNIQGDEETKMIHIIDLHDGEFPDQHPERIECDDIIEFKINDGGTYDIYQVYKDGNDYYRVNNGYELKSIKTRTAENDRRLLLSLALNQEHIDLYFCIIPSSQRDTILETRKCPRKHCEKNRLTIKKCEIKFALTDEKDSHKVYLHKGDTVEIDWTSKTGTAYRIEEKRYCPISGGLYTVEHKGENPSTRPSARGKYSKTFNDFGMSFLFRLTETNQIHDVIVCIINDTYKVKHVEVKDTNIEPNIIWIEQSDWIVFEWNTKRKQTVIQIDPFSIDENQQKAMETCIQFREKHQSIELKTEGQHFYWPNEPSRRGFMVHQFNEAGLFCYKTENNQIGTIVVEPRKNIYHVPIFGDQLIHEMNTKDLVQFDWKMTDSQEEPVLITIDSNSSVVPDAAGGLTGVFDCEIFFLKELNQLMSINSHLFLKETTTFSLSNMIVCLIVMETLFKLVCSFSNTQMHKSRIFLRHHFYTCEAFLLSIPQHGLYNFSITDTGNCNLISVIVQNGIDNHRVLYDEDNQFKPTTLIINRGDQVWFDSASTTVGGIHQTDEFGNRLNDHPLLFQPQENSVNYFMKDFQHEGIFYFSTDLNSDKQDTSGKPLAIIVVPDIRFHCQSVHKDEFDAAPIITNINDFVIWKFEHLVAHNLVQLDPDEKIHDLIASHERAKAGRNRQCLGLECITPGTYFFSNPEFERGTGLDQHRLVSTVIIDRPFSQNCFIVSGREFVPDVLHIVQNDTISWTIAGNDRDHQIYIQHENQEESEEDHDIRQDIEDFIPDVHHLHTFNKPGRYIVRSDRFKSVATVNVYTEDAIRSEKRRVHEPKFVGEIDTVSHFGTQVHLSCPSRSVDIYYTLDGSIPTRHFDNVQPYNPETGVLLNEPGLHVIRAYSAASGKISSSVIASPLTFVLESKEIEAMHERRGLWDKSKVGLSASLQRPNKLYGKIDVQPTTTTDLIDYFELYVNGVAQKKTIPGTDTQFSAEGFAGGEQYEVSLVAYPKTNLTDAEPIASNTQAFEIQREVQGGAPLISLSVSNDRNVLFLLWAHIGDHVSEYIVYVDSIEIKTITEKEFNRFYAIQFHGPQPKKKYLLQVEAKIKDNNDIRKSNIISVTLPLDTPFKGTAPGYFPYIVIKDETPPPDARLEPVQFTTIPNPQPEPERKDVALPISNGLRNAIPKISYRRNPNGITLFWKAKTPAIAYSIEYFRIVVDNEPYGKLISPHDETKYHVNLAPGTHECYLELLPKDKDEEVYKTNVLEIDVPTGTGLRQGTRQQREPSNEPIYKVLEQKDAPIPKLNIQSINSSSIRITWYLDRPMPTDVFVALYEVHVQGQDFPAELNSDEQSKHDGYTEHIWYTNNPPLEIVGISDRQEYTIFVRALFHVQGLTDIDYLKTISNRVITTSVDPLIDLLTRPLLQVTHVGLQMASLQWKLDESTDLALVKGYRIILNSKPTEILPSNQHEYELTGLKPDTENEVQVSVTSNPDFVDEKISEPIRIVCPPRPLAPKIESTKADKPFSIAIKWKHDRNDQDDVTSYKIFLNGKLHGEIETNGQQSFKYDLSKLQTEQNHSIYVKSVIGPKKLAGNARQCGIESNASNELFMKCAIPPRGTTPRLERLDRNGIDISWDAPEQYGDVNLTGYTILQNNRVIGKPLPADTQHTSIKDLEMGISYSFQIVPLTDQPGGVPLRAGEEYNAEVHSHYIPGPKLKVDYTGFVQVPTEFRVENITGHSALVWWSSIDESSSSQVQPDSYTLRIWNNEDIKSDRPMTVKLTKDKTSAQLKDLKAGTKYEVQLEVHKTRRHQTTNVEYPVVSSTDVLTFVTGSPPDAPSNLHLIACTNTDARIGFDSFIEHDAEVKAIRIQCESISSATYTKEISFDIQPDLTDFILTNLTERTDYKVTIYGLTQEYLHENKCPKFEQLPKKLKPSDWLPSKSFEFKTSGYESVSVLNIRQATTESIQLDWRLPKVYGSTKYVGQVLRWKLEHGSEEQRILDRTAVSATIAGPIPSGLYTIFLDSIFSVRVNLEDYDDESTRNEIISTVTASISVRFHVPGICERPEIYLTGYTISTIDLSWNKPNLFNIIDHPEKNNERLKIHRQLLGYQVNINGRLHNKLDEDQYRCTLTECKSGEKYEVQLISRTTVQSEYLNETTINETDDVQKPDETPSKKLRIRMLKDQDLLRSLQANFEFNHTEYTETTSKQGNVIEPIGKINVHWTVSNAKDISHFILQWHSSKDLHVHQKTIASNETSTTIDSCDEKHHYVIEIIIVTNSGERQEYEKLTIPIPGEPDAPKLWLVKTTDTSFTIEWSEPKSYGIPVIGFQLFIAGRRAGGMIAVNLRRVEIPSRINRTYQVTVCAVTNNRQRPLSIMSETLPVITTPTTNLVPTMYFGNDDGSLAAFDRSVARIIPLQIETVNEEKVHLDWTSFLPTAAIRAYYVQYKCLNNGEVQAMKVSKRFRHTILRGLRPGFTYGIMIMAVDKNDGVLYTSDKNTVQMNAPPNAPIVSISERVKSHVKLQWCQAIGYGDVAVVGYKIYVNNRLAANLRHDQLTYTLTNGRPCEVYTVHVQALSNDKNIVSPMSRGIKFAWPGIRPGAFKRIDDGQTGNIIVAWEHPKLEDESEKLLGYKLCLVNMSTGAEHLIGEYDAATQQATIQELNYGKYGLRLIIEGEINRAVAGPIIITSGRFNSLLNRQTTVDPGRCFQKNQRRLRSPTRGLISPQFRHIQPS